MSFKIDTLYLQNLCQELVRIDSTNPSLTPNAAGERALGEFIASTCKTLGLEVATQDLSENRMNVIATLKGTRVGKSLMLNGHLDTVGVEGMKEPFSARVSDGRLFGRGAQDMKGSLAAMLACVKALNDAAITLKGDLILSFVADEEANSIGMERLLETYRADAAIVTEPTNLELCLAHRGFVWFEVETFGRAAHGSRYAEGIDANMHMGLFLADLNSLANDLLARTSHPLAGPPSLHVARLQGGTENSTYAANCKAIIERRTIPGETLESTRAELERIIADLKRRIPSFDALVKVQFERSPFEISADTAIVTCLEKAVQGQLKQDFKHTGGAFWTDAALLSEKGIPSVLIGPIGEGLHSAEEWVDLASLNDLAAILARVAIDFCA